jgi:methionyl-tRNA synthetase
MKKLHANARKKAHIRYDSFDDSTDDFFDDLVDDFVKLIEESSRIGFF